MFNTRPLECRLQHNVVTPTTKSEDHDEPISPPDIVARGLMSQEDLDQVSHLTELQLVM